MRDTYVGGHGDGDAILDGVVKVDAGIAIRLLTFIVWIRRRRMNYRQHDALVSCNENANGSKYLNCSHLYGENVFLLSQQLSEKSLKFFSTEFQSLL